MITLTYDIKNLIDVAKNNAKLFTEFKKSVTDEELKTELDIENRTNLINLQIKECEMLCDSSADYSIEIVKTLTDFISQMNYMNIKPNKHFANSDHKWAKKTETELETLKNWKQRDEEINAQILKAGEQLDNIENIFVSIEKQSSEQAKLVAQASTKSELVSAKLLDLEHKLDKLILSYRTFNFTLKFLLSVIIIIIANSCAKLISKHF